MISKVAVCCAVSARCALSFLKKFRATVSGATMLDLHKNIGADLCEQSTMILLSWNRKGDAQGMFEPAGATIE